MKNIILLTFLGMVLGLTGCASLDTNENDRAIFELQKNQQKECAVAVLQELRLELPVAPQAREYDNGFKYGADAVTWTVKTEAAKEVRLQLIHEIGGLCEGGTNYNDVKIAVLNNNTERIKAFVGLGGKVVDTAAGTLNVALLAGAAEGIAGKIVDGGGIKIEGSEDVMIGGTKEAKEYKVEVQASDEASANGTIDQSLTQGM